MQRLLRREFVGGLALAGLMPGAALAAAVSPLRPLFDQATTLGGPMPMLRLLRRFDATRLGRVDAAIYRMVLRGLEREIAASANPDYALRLSVATGTDVTPLELDQQVADATASLLARADRLLRQFGLAQGNVGARLRELRQREDLYSNDDAGRSRAVADMNAALDRLRPQLARWFNAPLELGSSVRRMSAAEEREQKRGYRESPFYYPDLSAVRDRPRWTLVTVAYHETVPGHLLQMGRKRLADPHPLQVKHAAGYAEGWAIYAESLVDRMGLLSPVEQLGFIQSWLFRLARVTIGIGFAVHGWSRDRAIEYLEQTVGFELFFPFATEADRSLADPTRSIGDAVVALWLRRRAANLRVAALRRFHDAVLDHGPLSVEALAEIA